MVNPTVEKLISDHSFLNYCLGNKDSDELRWAEWVEQHPEHTAIVKQARELVLLLVDQPTEQELTTERNRMLQYIDKPAPSQLRRLWWPAVAAAAVLVVASISYKVFVNQSEQIGESLHATAWVAQQVPDKKMMHIHLVDGTAVKLFPGSSFSYPQSFQDSIREVKLNGGGYFQVQHDLDKPFVIHTQSLAVRVLGTSFNLQAYETDTQTKVALFEGKVIVAQGGREEILQPGQAFIFDKQTNEGKVSDFDTEVERAVSNGLLVFHHADYQEVARQLTRKYGVKWQSKGKVTMRFSGQIDQEPLQEVLDHLTYTTDYRFTLQKDSVLVQQK